MAAMLLPSCLNTLASTLQPELQFREIQQGSGGPEDILKELTSEWMFIKFYEAIN